MTDELVVIEKITVDADSVVFFFSNTSATISYLLFEEGYQCMPEGGKDFCNNFFLDRMTHTFYTLIYPMSVKSIEVERRCDRLYIVEMICPHEYTAPILENNAENIKNKLPKIKYNDEIIGIEILPTSDGKTWIYQVHLKNYGCNMWFFMENTQHITWGIYFLSAYRDKQQVSLEINEGTFEVINIFESKT